MSTSEHWRKYDALACRLGWRALVALVPLKRETIRDMIAAGDEHLNGKGLAPWDRAALGVVATGGGCCPTCGQRRPLEGRGNDWPYNALRRTARDKSLPWHKVPTLSLAGRVCVLKHVAREGAVK